MKRLSLFLLLSALLCTQCTKTKLNSTIVPPGGLNQTNSSVRIYNLFGFNFDVSVNSIPLTPYGKATNGNAYSQAIFGGGYFKDGTSFTVPYDLLDKNGNVHVHLSPNLGSYKYTPPNTLLNPIDTILHNDPLNPIDYYILGNGHFLALPRSLAAPAVPSHFKIRVVNQGSPTDLNQITGPVTLTYADGTPVDPALTNITPGTSSSYVELPYGAIEFKLFAANGGGIDNTRQLSLMVNNSADASAGPKPNWAAGDFPGSPIYLQDKRFAFSKVYEPGGTYSIFVSQNVGLYLDAHEAVEAIPLNSFHILTESSPPLNITYARLQGVNALPAAGAVTFKVDGQPIGSSLAFAAHSDYGIFIQGTHTVEADDAQGNVLVRTNFPLYANDNITAWLYRNDSVPGICFTTNDMSVVNSNVQLQVRFLNLAPNVLYATFLGQNFGYVAVTEANDTTGRPTIAYDPYYNGPPFYNWNLTPFQNGGGADVETSLRGLTYYTGQVNQYGNPIFAANGPSPFTNFYAFRSNPGVVPGAYLSDVAAIADTSFIANPALYSAQSSVPPAEPGVYTVALIGIEGDSTDAFYPRMMILKHTK